ncbi:hypothetical protein [Exiguobacterium acetylicum]|uniref:hypothetical protein n=1 Tax=Exiguobacterium acetylicum TaxID=41170 RepID=UPI001CA60DB5|nr:hypothetical protein [Exiguobacterium acetylicum]QZY85570.1 hypothetical protein K7G97_09800 [Exiguobacterium acetylicum]
MNPEIIYFVCESGMASSVMGATILRKRLLGCGITTDVKTCRIVDLPNQASFIVGEAQLVHRHVWKAHCTVHAVERILDPTAYDVILESWQKRVRLHD